MRIFADDLTGAADCATVLGVQGQAVRLCLDARSLSQASHSYSLNLGTRSCQTPQAVYDKTKQALLALSPTFKGEGGTSYFKVDSTWRSDAVAIALAGFDTLKPSFVFLCPAFPQEGRTIVNGVAYLHGIPLDETPLKEDPQHPLMSSDVKLLLERQAQKLNRQIHVLSGKAIEGEDLKAILKTDPQTPLFVVPDVQTSEELRNWAERIASFKDLPLCIGSAGLLEALLALPPLPMGEGWGEGFEMPNQSLCFPHPNLLPKGEGTKGIQVISGSLNPTTIQQIEALQSQHPDTKVLNTASWGKFDDWQARFQVESASFLESPNTVNILCGGDTAEGVLAQAGVTQLKWVRALTATCSLWQAVESEGDSGYWVLKSGNMGEVDLLVQLVMELYHAFSIPSSKHL